MQSHVHPADAFALVGAIDPDAYSVSTQSTGWIDARDLLAIMLVGMTGTQAGGQRFKFQQATDSSGAGAKDVPSAQTELRTTDDRQQIVSVLTSALDADNGFRFVRAQAQTTGNADMAAIVIGIPNRTSPASDLNASTVGEVVRV